MESKSKILKKETDELVKGIEAIEPRFKLLEENPEGYLNKFFPDESTSDLITYTVTNVFIREPLFFTNRAVECAPLIDNCTEALDALPDETPEECRIRRSQFVFIASKLTQLISNFSNLQIQLNIFLNPVTTAANKTLALGSIIITLPDTFIDFDLVKEESEKVKKAMTF